MRLKLCLLLVFIISYSWSQTTQTFNTNGTFLVPNGVTAINVQAWGGGGSGGGASGAPLLLGRGAAGGGGGAFASAALSVTGGSTLNVVVAGQTSGSVGNGTSGGNSTITGFESSLLAAGGSGGAANNAGGSPVGGSGGTVAASAGTTRLAGANGGNGNSWNLLGLLLSSGAGGNGANSGGAGGAAVSGLILSNAPGNGGSIPGGAGSGAINSASGASQIGGSGAAGQVIISYTCPAYSITSTTGTDVCTVVGSSSTITLTAAASSLPVGNYVVTYNRSNPGGTALTANLTVTTAGTGTFTAIGLTDYGASTITITKITSNTCFSNITANNTVTITVSPESFGGTVTGGTTIVSGNTSGLLTLSGHTGLVVKWQSAVSPFTTWVDIANTTTTYTSGPLTATTQFRAVVKSGACAAVNSQPTTVTVNQRPTITLTSSTVSRCANNDGSAFSVLLPYTATTENPITYSIVWDPSVPNTFVPVTDAALPANQITLDLPAGLVSGTYTGTLTVKNANGVVSSPGTSFTVTVNGVPSISTSGTTTSICSSTNPQNASLPYSAVTGNPTSYTVNWSPPALGAGLLNQASTPFSFVSGGGILNTIQVPANTSAGTHVGEIIISNGNCTFTQPLFLKIVPATVGGTVTGGTTINSGDTSGLLTLSGYTGSVLKWQSSVSPFTTWVDIANTTSTYTSGPLTETTQFRAVVQSGNCAVENSAATTVTVNQRPTITLTSSTVSQCSTNDGSSLSVLLPYTATTENPITYSIVWDPSVPNTFVPVTDAAMPANQIIVDLPAGLVSGNFSGTLTVKNANGAVSSPGTSFTVTVNETPLITTSGTIASVCTSSSSQTTVLDYSGVSGNPISYSIDWNTIANAASLADQPVTSFAFASGGGVINSIAISPNVAPGTYYGIMNIFNGICNESQNVTITIDAPAVGGTVTGGTTITSGNTSGLLTLSGHTGSVVKWQSAVSPFTTWVDLTLTDGITTYTSNPLTETTQFRAVLRSGNCDYAYSEPTTVTVEDLPTIVLDEETDPICLNYQESTDLGYTATTGDPVSYSIVWNSLPANSLAPVIDEELNPSYITIQVPSGTAPGNYTGTLTVKNAAGFTSIGSTFDLVVSDFPTLNIEETAFTVCAGNAEALFINYTSFTGNPNGYGVDWDDTANAAFLEDEPAEGRSFSQQGGSLSFRVGANVLPGTYTGILTIYGATGCNTRYEVTLKVLPATLGGAVTGGTTVAFANPSGLLTLSGHTGSVVKWQSSVSPFTTWTDIANTNTTYTSDPLTATTQFRAVVQQGSCEPVNSEPTTVTVNPVPPSIELLTTEIHSCTNLGPHSVELPYAETSGSPITYSIVWEQQDFITNPEDVIDAPLPASPIIINLPSIFELTYHGTLTVKNANGIVSSGLDFYIVGHNSSTVNTTTNGFGTCAGSETVNLAYLASNGNPLSYSIDWDDTANAAFLADVPVTPYSFNPNGGNIVVPLSTNALGGIYNGIITIYDEYCSDSRAVQMSLSESVAGTVTGGSTISSGSTSDLLTLSGQNGSVVKWQSAVSPFTTWTDIENGETTYTSEPLTETTQFRAVVQRGICPIAYSEPTTVTVEELPSIQLTSTTVNRCLSGDSFILHYVALSYNQVTGNPVTYSIVWDSSPTNTFTAVTDAPLPASPIAVLVPYDTASGIYTGTLTVKNVNGIESSPVVFNVRVSQGSAFINTTGTITPVTISASPQTTTLPYSNSVNNPYEYYIDWDETANAASLADQANTPFAFSPSGGTIDSIDIPANVPSGTYNGTLYTVFGSCTSPHSVTVTVNADVPSIALTTNYVKICGDNTDYSGFLPYSGTTGNPTTYSLVWSSSPANNFVSVTDAALTPNSIRIRVPINSTEGAYDATFTVKNANGSVSNPIVLTVNVGRTPSLFTNRIVTPVTTSTSEQITTLPYTSISGPAQEYSIDWDADANAALLQDQPFTPYAFSASGGNVDNIVIPANVPAGTYIGFITIKGSLCQSLSPSRISVVVNPSGARIADTSNSAENSVTIASLNKVIDINAPNQKINQVYVYDLAGSLIYKKDGVSDSKLEINNLRSGNQILVVKVVLDNNKIETKKVIY